MKRFEKTTLWQKTLAIQLDPDTEATNRARLRAAYESFRERAGVLAAEIAIVLPEFTVHDITHLDALWEMAQLITGEKFTLTPAEAFVLGGAFLIHDLGMGLAAYPKGVDALQKTELWHDTVASLLQKKHGRQSTIDEVKNPPEIIRNAAIRQVLRELHAKHAEHLALISWQDCHPSPNEYFLIDDPTLRNTYGPIIGKIAHSHWWPTEQLIQDLPREMGAPGGFDNSWTVDSVKLACILRTADASHLDERRAPGFLTTLRKPAGISADHWSFQEKLYQPRLESDRLVYTSKDNFSVEEASAWWACFDALKVVDRELRQVDSLLADTNRPRLSARGVAYIDDPLRLAKLIGTSTWLPIDAKIQVGDVARLIGSLGGEKLYGRNETVPLRELIQNASDAVRARRLVEGRPADWGWVTVRTGEDINGRWVEVEDSGVGMSINVLTGPFLDFGNSFWGTPLMHKELPGLESKGFSSSGQFGIGFFSVFMWGGKVQVITRRAERARDETLILEFQNGLTSRPILRKAHIHECLIEGGTRIRVWMSSPTIFNQMLRDSNLQKPWTLEERCAWLCPTLDVNLYVENKNKKLVVGAYDWISIKGSKLLQRLFGPRSNKSTTEDATLLKALGPMLRLLTSPSGEVVGRACVSTIKENRTDLVDHERVTPGVVTIGGFRSCELRGIFGVFVGKPHTAARDIGVPVADIDILRLWAAEQADLIFNESLDSELQVDCASIIRALNGATQKFHIANGAGGWKSAEEISKENLDDEVLILQDAALYLAHREFGEIKLHKNVFAVAMGIPGILQTRRHDVWINWPPENDSEGIWGRAWRFHSRTLNGALIEAIAKAWNIPLRQISKVFQQDTGKKTIKREIGLCNGNPVVLGVYVIRKPKSS
ncbi:ATP-binding protein [Nitrosospira lacus]|uniref:ATP-binding protein n=1 Tax=Nitrosospira lacus TaxID=1288494 RepID=A0A1W6SRT8_9PROT|nr:ATP-binding protein [Nitrosospira lacus]ARO88512.1 ATP-binding protein [Nitrosospira lacus]